MFKDITSSSSSSSGAEGSSSQVITKANAILAYEEVFKMWKVELDPQQANTFKTQHFDQMWKRVQENNVLDLKDSYRFLKDLMTSPVSATNRINE
jgi:hypothetical protein